MKKINDEKIKKYCLSHQDYRIHTTSDDILNKKASLSYAKKERHYLPYILSLSSAFIGVATIVVGINLIINQKDNNNIYLKRHSSVVYQQLLTFNAFNSTHQSRVKRNNANISENSFSYIVDSYDEVEQGIRDLFAIDEYAIVDIENKFTYLDHTYLYEIRIIDNDHNILSRVYYNKDKNDKYLEALYEKDHEYYQALISFKNEIDEEEITTILSPLSVEEPYIYVIEKEKEYDGKIVENSYSYMTYSSIEDYYNDEDNYLLKIEYEIEDNDIDVTYIENNKDLEIEFTMINKLTEYHYSFNVDEYEYNNEEIENITIDLYYLEDNSRKYVYQDFTKIKN